MSILKNSKRLSLLPEFRSGNSGLREYVIENDNFYLLYHSQKEQNVKHKVRCIKKLDGFKIYAEATNNAMGEVFYYVLDLRTKEVFTRVYDTATGGSFLPILVREIETLRAKESRKESEYDFLASSW